MRHMTGFISALAALAASAALILNETRCSADLRVNAVVGYDRLVRPDTWNPAVVILTGTGATMRAQVQIVRPADASGAGTITFTRKVDLHAGVLDERIPFAYIPDDRNPPERTRVRVVSEGRVLAEQPLPAVRTLISTQPLIIALTQDRSGLNYLHQADLATPHWPYVAETAISFGRPTGLNNPRNPCAVAYPEPFSLPSCPEAYTGADCVVLGDLSLDALSDDQWNALIQWVRDGGELVISGVPDISRLRDPRIAQLLPIIPQGTRQMPNLTALAARYRSPGGPGPCTVVTGSVRPDSVLICTQGPVPLILTRREGCGVVVFTSFDLASHQIRSWPESVELWKELMRLRNPELSASAILQQELQRSSNYFTPQQFLPPLGDALAGLQATAAPGIGFIGLYLAAYIVCLVPLNYLILRRKDRREWAWITAPMVVLAFSIGAYGVGYALRGSSVRVGCATILEGAAGERSLRALTLATIFSPSPTAYDLHIPDAQAVARDVFFAPNLLGVTPQDLTVEEGPRHGIHAVPVRMWSTRSFQFVSHVDLNGEIAATFIPGNLTGTVRITNNTSLRLTNCAVSYGYNTTQIGNLEPYSTTQAPLRVSVGESWGRISLTEPMPGAFRYYGGSSFVSPTGTQEDRIRQTLAAAITGNSAQVSGADPLLFTGWTYTPIPTFTVHPGRAIVRGTTLVAIHIPLPARSSREGVHLGTPPRSRQDPFAPAPSFRVKRPLPRRFYRLAPHSGRRP